MNLRFSGDSLSQKDVRVVLISNHTMIIMIMRHESEPDSMRELKREKRKEWNERKRRRKMEKEIKKGDEEEDDDDHGWNDGSFLHHPPHHIPHLSPPLNLFSDFRIIICNHL